MFLDPNSQPFLSQAMNEQTNKRTEKSLSVVCIRANWPTRPELISVQQQEAARGISTLSGWDACPSQGYPPPSIKFIGTHLYSWVERGCVRVKCLAQEHNTMSPARTRTRSARSGVERTNHEAAGLRACSQLGVVIFIKTNIQSNIINTTTIICLAGVFHGENCPIV